MQKAGDEVCQFPIMIVHIVHIVQYAYSIVQITSLLQMRHISLQMRIYVTKRLKSEGKYLEKYTVQLYLVQ